MTPHIPTAHEVETFTGRYVDTKSPDPRTIVIEDIAHALANTCRYGGHCQRFYSVAEHAVMVSKRVESLYKRHGAQLAALHHDDAEAYLGDIPRPTKPLLGAAYGRLTDRMDQAIIEALELPFDTDAFHSAVVKDADNWALFVEARHLLPSEGRHWWNGAQGAAQWGLPDKPSRIVTPSYWTGGLLPAIAEQLFIKRHKELTS